MKKKELIKKLNQDIENLKLEIKLHEIKDKYVEKSKDSKCFITALANTFECAADIAQAIKDKEPVIVGEKETERILKGSKYSSSDTTSGTLEDKIFNPDTNRTHSSLIAETIKNRENRSDNYESITTDEDHVNIFASYSIIEFPNAHEDDLKELVRSAKELSNKTTITIPNKPQGTKDLEIVLKSGKSYCIENNSGCEVNVKFE